MFFITGENIQITCDHFIGTKKDFNFNCNIIKYNNKFIYLGHNENIDNKLLVFCYTHILDQVDILINTLENMKNPFILIFHNSDYNFNSSKLVLFQKLPLLKHIFTQNMDIIHPKVSPIPIGLANSQWVHGNPKIHKEVYNMKIDKTKTIYFYFSIPRWHKERERCMNIIKKKGVPWINNLPYCEYLIELKKHKYCICPEGAGIDTHRFWECLYLNTIPICKKNILVEYYSKIFPIVLLDDWNDLDIANLDKNYSNININYEYLTMNYIQTLFKIKNI
jgi:hypothetical protein